MKRARLWSLGPIVQWPCGDGKVTTYFLSILVDIPLDHRWINPAQLTVFCSQRPIGVIQLRSGPEVAWGIG